MALEVNPTLLRLSAGIPTAGVGGLLGYLMGPKEHRLEAAARGAGMGYMAGTGLGVGAELGHRTTEGDNKIPGMLMGGLAGGAAGLGIGKVMQGVPAWEQRRKFREELLAVLKEEMKQEQPNRPEALQKIGAQEQQLASVAQFAKDYPEAAIPPLGALIGGAVAKDTNRPITDTVRGAATGGAVGLGAVAGGRLGSLMTQDPTTGTLLGGGVGGLVSYLATRHLMRSLASSENEKEKRSAGPVLRSLLQAKAMSDRKDYRGKHHRLRQLIEQHPDDFFIDSENDGIVGLTHFGSGFQIHAPKNILPAVKLRRFDDASVLAA